MSDPGTSTEERSRDPRAPTPDHRGGEGSRESVGHPEPVGRRGPDIGPSTMTSPQAKRTASGLGAEEEAKDDVEGEEDMGHVEVARAGGNPPPASRDDTPPADDEESKPKKKEAERPRGRKDRRS